MPAASQLPGRGPLILNLISRCSFLGVPLSWASTRCSHSLSISSTSSWVLPSTCISHEARKLLVAKPAKDSLSQILELKLCQQLSWHYCCHTLWYVWSCCKRWSFGLVNGQVSLRASSIALRTQELYTWPRICKKVAGCPWTSPRRFSHKQWPPVHSRMSPR